MFSRLGVFTGCEGECREALIVDESDGVLQERCLAGWKERDVRMSLLAILRPQAVSNIEAPLPAIIVGYVGLLWGSFGVLGTPGFVSPTARQYGFAHNSLPSFWVIMAPSGTWRLNSHSCRFSFMQGTGLAGTLA